MTPIRKTFFCVDGHTCGCPVRLVAGGGPPLVGATMSEKRQDFLANWDWIRTALMFEPRGHDVMSGSILYPPTHAGRRRRRAVHRGLGLPADVRARHDRHRDHGAGARAGARPREPGRLNLDTPAGRVVAEYEQQGRFVERVRLTNVSSYLALSEVRVDCPELGELVVDIAYGGNFYAIVEPQPNYPGLDGFSADQILRLSPLLRRAAERGRSRWSHPVDPTIRGVHHIQWTGQPRGPRAHARNAVFYGDKAIDRSPCGTGTSARMAQLAAKGRLQASATSSSTRASSAASSRAGSRRRPSWRALPAIVPSIAGWARMTGQNTIFVDERDPYWRGFQVT